jgi:hypothetical protein
VGSIFVGFFSLFLAFSLAFAPDYQLDEAQY